MPQARAASTRATTQASRAAFRADAALHRAGSAAKALWWTAAAAAGRAYVRPAPVQASADEAAPPPPAPKAADFRRAWLDAFARDAADVEAGLYPVSETPARPAAMLRTLADLFSDAREVEARRERRGGVEARGETGSDAYPTYYRQNFHFQSGGWLTAESARRYEAQVEALFAGSAGPMRRRALSLLAKAWRGRDQRELTVVDVACGSGAFLRDLRGAFPRARVVGLDLSLPYLEEARRRSGAAGVMAAAERLPFADASLDAATCVYLFHELPPRVRPLVAAEFARVLKPAGLLAFADSIQADDAPELALPLARFPAHFHEPYYDSFQREDLPALFAATGLAQVGEDMAFLTKARLFAKA
jgi:ubiquinone/menaquinone biosynthesis C-methylase UbiE